MQRMSSDQKGAVDDESNSYVTSVQFVGKGQVALVAVQPVNGNQSEETYAYLDKESCQSLLFKSTVKKGLGLKVDKTGKMAISVYHMTKEIHCSKDCFGI